MVSGRREKRRAPAVSWRQNDAAENGGQRPEGRLPARSAPQCVTTPVVHQEKNKETNNQKNPLKMVLGGWEKNDEDETRDQGMLSC